MSNSDYVSALSRVKPLNKFTKEKKECNIVEEVFNEIKDIKKPDNIVSSRFIHYLACLIENTGKIFFKSTKNKINKLQVLFDVLEKVNKIPLTVKQKEDIKDEVDFLLELKVVNLISLMNLAYSNAKIFLFKALF
jgi:hypothetical protein